MKFSVVVFPGSNSDYDAFYAASRVLGEQATTKSAGDSGRLRLVGEPTPSSSSEGKT